MMQGDPVHAELIVDGDSSTLTVLKLYTSGTVTERALAANEFFCITDVFIQTQDGGDIALVADEAAAGKYIVYGNVAATGGVARRYEYPYVCPKGVVPKFSGAAANRNVCILEGFIIPQGTA